MAGYVPVNKIGRKAIQVTIRGTPLDSTAAGISAYDWFALWRNSTLYRWSLWCAENNCQGNWSWSTDNDDDQFRLHLWFDSPSDACVFKLMSADYSASDSNP
jgi:hypothetical protein